MPTTPPSNRDALALIGCALLVWAVILWSNDGHTVRHLLALCGPVLVWAVWWQQHSRLRTLAALRGEHLHRIHR
jgi:hypothetical protein